MLKVGLNPYGLTCAIGIQGANPKPLGLRGFVALAKELGSKCIELHNGHLDSLGLDELSHLGSELSAAGLEPIVSSSIDHLDTAFRAAAPLGARTIRVGLSPVLCGARAARPDWPQVVEHARSTLVSAAPTAARQGVTLAIENHQDFGSEELVDFCRAAGESVGICLDTGNPFAVAEAPIPFARVVAPLVRHVHLKDYRPQFTDEGYRLVRCAIGDGAVPFPAIASILDRFHSKLTASLEPGALEARHVRLLCAEWWQGYTPKTAESLAECLHAARVHHLPEDEDWHTPWERGDDPGAICEYELDMIRKSSAYVKSLGWM